MNNQILENWNSATRDYPFVDCDSRITGYFPHYHDEIEIMVIISGQLTFITAENGAQTATSGDICIFMPQQIHSFTSTSNNNHMYILKLYSRNSKEKVDFNLLRFGNGVLKKSDPFNAVLRKYIDLLCDLVEYPHSSSKEFNVKLISPKVCICFRKYITIR